MQDLESLQQKYRDNCKTISTRSSILKVYSFILQYECVDSDYWTIGGGYEEIDKLLNNFDDADWCDLAVDIPRWTLDQISLFAGGLFCIDYYKVNYNEDEITNLENRFVLITTVMMLGPYYHVDTAHFIADLMEIYFPKINFKNKKVLDAAINLKNWSDGKNWYNGGNPFSALECLQKSTDNVIFPAVIFSENQQ